MIRKAIAASSALAERDVQVLNYGSYRNNTNADFGATLDA